MLNIETLFFCSTIVLKLGPKLSGQKQEVPQIKCHFPSGGSALTSPWISFNIVMNFSGLMALPRQVAPQRMESPREVRRVKEGMGTTLVPSGLCGVWWNAAMECYGESRNDHDAMADGKTTFGKRFAVMFDGLVIPFGAKARMHQLGSQGASWNLCPVCLTCGESMDLIFPNGSLGSSGNL